MKYNDINKIHYFLWMISADVQASRCTVCLSSLSHLPVRFSFHLSRLHGIKITQRKAENQIKMAKMIMMNELNKRANLLIEQLEVITFFPFFLSIFLRHSKRIHLQTSSWRWMYWWWSVRNRTSSERIMQNRQIPPSSDIFKQMGILGKVLRRSVFLPFSFVCRVYPVISSNVWRTSCRGP